MKYFLEKSTRIKDNQFPIVLRGVDSNGKPYRFFIKIDGQSKRVRKKSWDQKKQIVRGDKLLTQYLKDLKTKLEGMRLEAKIANPKYSIPDAWKILFGKPEEEEQTSDLVIDSIAPYVRDNQGNKSKGYLRHFTQLKNELIVWNKALKFSDLNEIALNSFLQYLKGVGDPVRNKPLRSSTINHHFKHLRQVSKYISKRGIKVDPTVYDFNPGKVVHELGCFDLTFDELMTLWHYKPANKTEEIVLDQSLFEAFTGIRQGDIRSIKDDGSVHGVKCGDVGIDSIGYRDRKNDSVLKNVTRHKFNDVIVLKYLNENQNEFLFPPIAQQTANSVIKEIAEKCGLNRGIRRGSEIKPLHKELSSHCFRSSYGNLLFRLGIPTEVIAEELGHSGVTITVKHYLRFSERHKAIREALNRLEISNPNWNTSSKQGLNKVARML